VPPKNKYYSKPARQTRAVSSWGILFVLLIVSIIIASIAFLTRSSLEKKVTALKEAIEFVKSEYEFAQIIIRERKDGNIRFELRLIDSDNKVSARETITLRGSDVFLECRVVLTRMETTQKAFVFPFRVYTDRIAPKDGRDILPLYVKDSFPSIYRAKDAPADYNLTVAKIFETAFLESDYFDEIKSEYITKIFDTSVHQAFFGNFKLNRIYRAVVHPDGGVQLIEEGN
jgi:hypothetical protein